MQSTRNPGQAMPHVSIHGAYPKPEHSARIKVLKWLNGWSGGNQQTPWIDPAEQAVISWLLWNFSPFYFDSY